MELLEPVDDELLVAQVSPIMSPLVWDLAHIGWFEELWLVRRDGEQSLEGFDDLYDAFRHERAERSSLPILQPAEARAYLAHPVLGARLIACCEAALAVDRGSAHEIFGSPDDLKLRSCVTLFAHVSEAGSIFHRVLDRFYDGIPDPRTLERLR